MQYLIDLRDQIMTGYGPQVFQVARALGILVIGWIVALAAQAFVRAALKKTTLDNRLAKWVLGEKKEESVEVERWVGKAVYYLLLLFVLVAFLNALNLGAVSEPLTALLNKVFSFLPNIAGALLLLGVAWILASVLRRVVSTALDMARLDERIGGEAGLEDGKRPGLAKTVSDAVYWLVFLLFLPNILEALSLEGLLLPVQGLIDRILTYLPNIVAAAVILAVGWFIARIVQRIVVNILTAIGVDALGHRVGLDAALGTMTLSGLARDDRVRRHLDSGDNLLSECAGTRSGDPAGERHARQDHGKRSRHFRRRASARTCLRGGASGCKPADEHTSWSRLQQHPGQTGHLEHLAT